MSERIHARYWLETGDDPQRAADTIAGEQSSGTFLQLANETPELKARSGARVEALRVLETVAAPSLPHGMAAQRHTRCEVELSWPIENLGPSLPNLLSTVAGNLFELRQVSGLRLLSLQLPRCFGDAYAGPAFGAEGTRRLAGVPRGPLIGTIIKPSVGLDPAQTAHEVQALVDGGIDFVKDDELQADGPHCPFEARVDGVMRVVHAAEQRLGRRVMVAFNITGEIDEMRRRHDHVLARGGNCVMVVLPSVGVTGVVALRRHSALPIHGHRAGWGYLSRCPQLGWDFAAWQPIWRLAGVDHLHVNGLRNKFSEPDAMVLAAARSVLQPLWPDRPMTVMPVFSSAQTGLQAHDTVNGLGSPDLICTAGGGIFGHPAGVTAGVAAMRQAWGAASNGVPLAQAAQQHPELQQALGFW